MDLDEDVSDPFPRTETSSTLGKQVELMLSEPCLPVLADALCISLLNQHSLLKWEDYLGSTSAVLTVHPQ